MLTREPGGTATGEHIRALLLDPDLPAFTPRAETLLMLAARAQHVAEVIIPACAAGRDVVCDRFSGSTIAYQGYGRGLDPAQLGDLSAWAAGGLEADLVVLLTVPPAEAAARRAARSSAGGGGDRFEEEEAEFFARVDAGFAALAGGGRRGVGGGGGVPGGRRRRGWPRLRFRRLTLFHSFSCRGL